MRQLLTPLPSIAAGAGPFLVRDNEESSGGCSAPPTRKIVGLFQSPFSISSPLALGIRAHEYGHLGLWRQKLEPSIRCLKLFLRRGIHNLWIQGTLDVVVNHFMMARGNRDVAELLLWQEGLELALPRWAAATLYLRAEGLRYAALMRMSLLARRADLAGEDLIFLNQAAERLACWGAQSLPLNARDYFSLLRNLQSRFGPDSPNAENPLTGIAGDFLLDGPERGERAVKVSYSGTPGIRIEIEEWCSERADIPWGPMDILTPPLIHPCRKLPGMAKRKVTCGYSGAFRFPSRALPASDGRAFTSRRPHSAHCGTLLIDCSGSMGSEVTHDRLMEVLARSPSTTIALYAGGATNQSGSLLIVARNCMHAAPEVIANWPHSGNVVDGPALEWLSRQKMPRVWVSDGAITGTNDRSADNLQVEVNMILSMSRIRRVATLDDLLEEEQKET